MSELLTTFESLSVGDQIVVPQYTNPLTVTEVGEFTVELEGPRGGQKSLVQNYHNEEIISLLAGTTSKGTVTEMAVVGGETTDNEDDNDESELAEALGPHRSNPNRPMKTNADVYETAARVLVHDTAVNNETVRIQVEHAEHDGGVCGWLCYTRSNVVEQVRKHLDESLVSDVVRVDFVDDAGIGLAESDVVDTPTTAVAGGISA